ncbi:InlB B-repeat-containing protein [Candidatus Magnetominusculus dajiuhuensis]|uniref:InlB B-repeat-containing protein n=1 Tax=Candidatus Magnetominusculus dajiuhuensis TaxID=3137712 RepID=UPI003B437159
MTLTATAASGSTFTSWPGCDSSSSNSCSVTIVSVKSVTAVFTASGSLEYLKPPLPQLTQSITNMFHSLGQNPELYLL